jgi:drug/metabolite transporter (DMT)-like permease
MLLPHLDLAAFARGPSGGPAVGVLFSLLAACCAAGATVQVRRLTATEKTGAIVFYFSLLTTALGLATIVLGWRMPGWSDFELLVVTGVLGGVGQILLTQSYRYADASLIAPFEYTTMIWALLIGWFAFGQMPQGSVIIGGLIVAFAGLFVLWRESRLGLKRARAAEACAQRPA